MNVKSSFKVYLNPILFPKSKIENAQLCSVLKEDKKF